LLARLFSQARRRPPPWVEEVRPHGDLDLRRVAVLIPGSPTRAFYSQVAAVRLALRKLTWTRWRPTVHLFLGGPPDIDAFAEWRPRLRDVDIVWSSDTRWQHEGDWAQCDETMRLAPRDADVILMLDADVLPVASLEDLLDSVVENDCVAGVMAHYPFPGGASREGWEQVAAGLIDTPLDFRFEYSLMSRSEPQPTATPFYVNFGVVAFSRSAYDRIVLPYLALRPEVEHRLENPFFSAQVALTLSTTATGVRTWALPMRYNFPNDSRAEEFYPRELEQVVAFHYLRTDQFDRSTIFTTAEKYSKFLSLPLCGVNEAFRSAVLTIFGMRYPFE
jgi:hypothetical protein